VRPTVIPDISEKRQNSCPFLGPEESPNRFAVTYMVYATNIKIFKIITEIDNITPCMQHIHLNIGQSDRIRKFKCCFGLKLTYVGGPKRNRNYVIKNCVFIFRCYKFSHLQSTVYLMQCTGLNVFSTFRSSPETLAK